MEDYLKLAEFLFEQSTIVQLLIVVGISIIAIIKVIAIKEFIYKRKIQTTIRTMAFSDSILRSVLTKSLTLLRNTLLERGTITNDDKTELLIIRLSLTNSLLIESKSLLKDILLTNGYYNKIKTNVDITELIEFRSEELRGINIAGIESVIRSSSPLSLKIGIVYNSDSVKKLLREFIDYSVDEIDSEINDINDEIKSQIGVLSKFFKYSH